MPNWLAKASGAVSRETDDQPQEFQLSCECGQLHRGHRKSKSQRIICQTCGAALFVLPRNVYPTIKPQTPKRRRKKSARRPGELPSISRGVRGVGRGTATAARALGRSIRSTGQSVERGVAQRATAAATFLRAQLTPFRLVLLGIVVMLAVTAAWTVHSRRLERAREILRVEFSAGEEALRKEDTFAAVEHFRNAAAAADRLQSDDVRSQQARQMLHETTVMTNLTSASLMEVLEEAERIVTGERPELWDDRFRVTYAETWLLLDAPIHLPIDSTGPRTVEVQMPLVVGEMGRTVRVLVEAVDVEDLTLSDEPQQAVFAAMLTGCKLDAAANRWLVTMSGESGFLWSELANLRRLGYFESEWVSEEETSKILDAQSQTLGVR